MTTAELPGRITVQACIACGTRFRGGECDDGCADVALELDAKRAIAQGTKVALDL